MSSYSFNVAAFKKVLKDLGMTYADLSKALKNEGISLGVSGIKQWCINNKPATPRPNVIKAIAKITNVPANHFTGDLWNDENALRTVTLSKCALGGFVTNVPPVTYTAIGYDGSDYNDEMFACIVAGNNFYPEIRNGDKIICNPNLALSSGDYVVYEANSTTQIRVYTRDNERRLIKLLAKTPSANFGDITIDMDGGRINCRLSKIVEVRHIFASKDN